MLTKKLWLITVVSLVVFVACLTVNVYFYPSEKVDKAATQIVEEIREKTLNVPQTGEPGSSENQEGSGLREWTLIKMAHAASDATTVTNAVIEAIKSKIIKRAATLFAYFDAGAIGEGNDGFVAVRNISVLPMKDRAKLNPVVKAENEDRTALYKEVARELGVKEGDIMKVQKDFAKQWQQSARAGWQIQGEDGQWSQR